MNCSPCAVDRYRRDDRVVDQIDRPSLIDDDRVCLREEKDSAAGMEVVGHGARDLAPRAGVDSVGLCDDLAPVREGILFDFLGRRYLSVLDRFVDRLVVGEDLRALLFHLGIQPGNPHPQFVGDAGRLVAHPSTDLLESRIALECLRLDVDAHHLDRAADEWCVSTSLLTERVLDFCLTLPSLRTGARPDDEDPHRRRLGLVE